VDCQLCSDAGARFRGAPHEGMHPDDEYNGVPLPDGRLVTFLCDACDDELGAYWLAVAHGEQPRTLFGEAVS
jgi:hypothetical protein